MARIKSLRHTAKGKGKGRNEDWCIKDDRNCIYIIADGFSGYEHDSAKYACEELYRGMKGIAKKKHRMDYGLISNAFREAINRVNSSMYRESRMRANEGYMSTTLDAVLIFGSLAYVWHVGDSRVYALYNSGELRQLTKDDSKAVELTSKAGYSLDEGMLMFGFPDNRITRRLGRKGEAQYSETLIDAKPVKRMLMATDGLTGLVMNGRLREIVSYDAPEDAMSQLKYEHAAPQPEVIESFYMYSKDAVDIMRNSEYVESAGSFLKGDELAELLKAHWSLSSILGQEKQHKFLISCLEDERLRPVLMKVGRERLAERDDATFILIYDKNPG